MAKKTEPLKFYQDQFNASWYELYELIEEDTKDIDTEDAPKLKTLVEYMDALGQLIDELVFAVNRPKKSKKSKKSKKK